MISEIQDKARLSNIAGAKHLELIWCYTCSGHEPEQGKLGTCYPLFYLFMQAMFLVFQKKNHVVWIGEEGNRECQNHHHNDGRDNMIWTEHQIDVHYGTMEVEVQRQGKTVLSMLLINHSQYHNAMPF